MQMFDCRVLNELGETQSLVDIDNGFRIETNVIEFTTTIKDTEGIFAHLQHENLEIALECQRQLAEVIHF